MLRRHHKARGHFTNFDRGIFRRGEILQEDYSRVLQQNNDVLLKEQELSVPDLPISLMTQLLASAANIQNDLVPVVDVSDTTNAPTGRTKYMTLGNMAEAIGIVNVKNHGAVGDGVTDDTAAFNSALAAADCVFFPDPSVGYLLTSKITIPQDALLIGQNKRKTKLLHGYNGDMFEFSDGCALHNLYLEGQGATFTGKGVLVDSTNGNQRIHNCRIINFDDACIDFAAVGAGSGFSGFDIEMYRTSAGTGTGRFAVTIVATQQLTATPRKFLHVETGGNCSFSFGGCNNTFVSESVIGDVAFTADSRAVNISSCRLLNQTALTVNGFNNTIVGGAISPAITIASGAGDNVIGPCSFNGSITDSSGLNTNQVFHKTQNYTPTFSAAGGSPAIGDGTIAGQFSREGTRVTFDAQFTVGSTTNLGTGQLRFGVPIARVNSTVLESCTVLINIGGTLYSAVGQFAGGVAYVAPIRDTSGSVTATSPAVFAAGDTVRISGSYYI